MSDITVYFRQEVVEELTHNKKVITSISADAVFITEHWVNLHELDKAGKILSVVNIPKDMVAFVQNDKQG